MGYRSEWQIIATGTEEQVKKLIGWMESYPDDGVKEPYSSKKGWIHDILQTARFAKDNSAVQFSEDSTKCYGNWEEVVRELLEHGRDELGLDMAYGRLGEDMEDFEFDNDPKGNAVVYYTRSLDDADFVKERES